MFVTLVNQSATRPHLALVKKYKNLIIFPHNLTTTLATLVLSTVSPSKNKKITDSSICKRQVIVLVLTVLSVGSTGEITVELGNSIDFTRCSNTTCYRNVPRGTSKFLNRTQATHWTESVTWLARETCYAIDVELYPPSLLTPPIRCPYFVPLYDREVRSGVGSVHSPVWPSASRGISFLTRCQLRPFRMGQLHPKFFGCDADCIEERARNVSSCFHRGRESINRFPPIWTYKKISISLEVQLHSLRVDSFQ